MTRTIDDLLNTCMLCYEDPCTCSLPDGDCFDPLRECGDMPNLPILRIYYGEYTMEASLHTEGDKAQTYAKHLSKDLNRFVTLSISEKAHIYFQGEEIEDVSIQQRTAVETRLAES